MYRSIPVRLGLKARTLLRLWKSRFFIFLFLLFCFSCPCFTEDCGRTFTEASGTFDSPNYPSNYHTNQDCSYLISVDAGSRITLQFSSFSLQSRGPSSACLDYVEIFDGNSTSAPSFGQYCGSEPPTTDKRTTQHEMLVRFHSDGTSVSSGFNASYSTDTKGDQIVVLAADDFLWRVDLITISTTDKVNASVVDLGAMEFDVFDYRVFWADKNGSMIHSILLNGKDQRMVISLGEDAAVADIALDSPSSLIFYADAGRDVIGVVTTTGDAHKRIIETALQQHSRIAVDTKLGMVYWTSFNAIKSAGYDGNNATTLYSLDQQRSLLSVTVDSQRGDVYFLTVDASFATIETLTDGRPSVIFNGSEYHRRTTRLVFYNDRIYYIYVNTTFSRRKSSYVNYVTIDGRLNGLLRTSNYIVEDVAFFNESAVHQEPTQCRANRTRVCGRGQICVPVPGNNVGCLTTDTGSTGTTQHHETQTETSTLPSPASMKTESDASVAAELDMKLVIVGGALGGFALLLIVLLIVVVLILVKRRGSECRSVQRPTALNEMVARNNENAYVSDSRSEDEVEDVYEKAVDIGVDDPDYVQPIPELPPRGI